MSYPLMKNWTAPDGVTYEVCDEKARKLAAENTGLDEETIKNAIDDYLEKNPIEGGGDGTEWTLVGRMTSAINGQVFVTLYENGETTTKTAYLSCLVSSGNAAFREHGSSKGAFAGEKSWSYGGDDGGIYWLCRAYEDSSYKQLLASCYIGIGASVTTENVIAAIGYTPASLPKTNNGEIDYGAAGQFAVSDGKGGINWTSLTNVGEVGA